MKATSNITLSRKTGLFSRLFSSHQLTLQAMVLPAVISVIIFSFIPMSGIVIAFKEYNLGKSLFSGEWVGFKYYAEIFADKLFFNSLRNTLVISLLDLLFCFPAPILLALVFYEAPMRRFKRIAQTASYLPNFLSYVVVASFWQILLDKQGLVNNILLSLGAVSKPVEFWTTQSYYWPLSVVVSLWKGTGWGAIIYFAAITNVSEEVYEAAIVDGAGRFRRVFSIVLPAIMNTVIVMWIMRMSGLFRGSFDQSYLLGNAFNREVSYVLEYYIIETGLNRLRMSYSTAINLLQSVLALVMLYIANSIAKRVSDSAIF